MLGTLQKLKSCIPTRIDSVDAVMNVFASSNVPIKYLHLSGDHFSGEHLMTITLNEMHLDIPNGLITVPENLLRTQPALKQLYIVNVSDTSSMSEIEKLLKYYGKNLKYFSYGVQKLNGDLESYESLLKAIRGRVFDRISSNSKVNVLETILKENEYLRIKSPLRYSYIFTRPKVRYPPLH